MDTLEKIRIEIWPFICLLEAKLVILGPIDFLFGLPINLIVNAGQNKFEVDILKNVAKIANLRPNIGQIPLLSLDINWHNSIIFYPILTFFFTRQLEWCPNQSMFQCVKVSTTGFLLTSCNHARTRKKSATCGAQLHPIGIPIVNPLI